MAAHKQDLIDYVRGSMETSRASAEAHVNAVLAGIAALTARSGKLELRDLGAFTVVDRAERKGRNPQTGEAITIPASKTVGFRPSKVFKHHFDE